MPSFYKSNLMDGYESTLIPPENDLKKEKEEIIKIDDDNDEANNTLKIQTFSSAPIQYPYKNIVNASHILIIIVFFFFFFYTVAFIMPKSIKEEINNFNIFNLLDPCNSSTVMPLSEYNNMKDKINATEFEMFSINTVTRNNTFNLSIEYSTEKLTNLSSTFTKLYLKIKEQKEIRFTCFKQNVEKQCENIRESRKLRNIDISVRVYLCIFSALFANSLYFIWKAKKFELSNEQKLECRRALQITILFVHFHVTVGIICIAGNSFFPCDVQSYLKKFPL